jgi:NADPH2:quinone reductase
MRAIQLTDYGSVDNMKAVDVPEPKPGKGEVLVKIAFAGLRFGDIMARHGDPVRHFEPPFEWIPGQEVTGYIEAVGEGVTKWSVGDRVFGKPRGGAYAEYVNVPEDRVDPVPDNVRLDVFLAYPINLRTAWFLVYPWGQVQPGQSVLVHSAAGGVGRLAVQIMKRKLWDVNVIALCGSDEKVEICKTDGADHVINYKTHDYVEEVEKIVGAKPRGFAPGVDGGGVHVSFNGVRGPTLKTDPMVIKKRGRWILYGHSGDKIVGIDNTHGSRELIDTQPYTYDGITIMPYSNLAWLGQPEQALAETFVRDWLQREELMEPTVYPLEEVPLAQRLMEEGKTTGKIVFKIGGEQ